MQQTDDPAEVAARLPARPEPRFLAFPGEEPQYFIIVENEILCICRSFSYAIMVWFISHYVFNLEYSIKVREVALFHFCPAGNIWTETVQNCNLSDCFYRHTKLYAQ